MRFIFCFFLLFSLGLQAQEVSGIVKDSLTQQTLAYVNVTYLHSDEGASTDQQGVFQLQLSEENKKDTLLISYVGYRSRLIPVYQLNSTSEEILLQQERAEIETVQLQVKKAKYTSAKKIGFKRKGDFRNANAYGTEACVWIKNEERRAGKLTEVQLFFKKNKPQNKKWKSYQAYFLVKFYAFDVEKRKPGKLLVAEPILIQPKNKRHTIKIDVEELNILYPVEGICIGVETIKPEHVKPTESMFATYPYQVYAHSKEALTWGSFRGKPWKKKRRRSYFKPNMFTNPLVKLKVKYRK